MPFLTFENIGGLERMKATINGNSPIAANDDLTAPNATLSTNPSAGGSRIVLTTGESAQRALIKAYLKKDVRTGEAPGLHVPRTLDQFYYHSLGDTDRRDGDQVIYRQQKKGLKKTRTNPTQYMICMVNQLWLWVVDDGKISMF